MRQYRSELEEVFDRFSRIDLTAMSPSQAGQAYLSFFNQALPSGYYKPSLHGYAPLYRACWINSENEERLRHRDGFANPPPDRCDSNRLNIALHPLFYAAWNWTTAIREIEKESRDGKRLYISRWDFADDRQWAICDAMPRLGLNEQADLFRREMEVRTQEWAESNMPKDPERARFLNDVFSRFLVADASVYPLTQWFGHSLLYEMPKGSRPEVIVYPSVAHEQASLCVALHPDAIKESRLTLSAVVEIELEDLEVADASLELRIAQMRLASVRGMDVTWR